MKKLGSLLMILSLIISTLISFNPKEVQAKSFEEKELYFVEKTFFILYLMEVQILRQRWARQ